MAKTMFCFNKNSAKNESQTIVSIFFIYLFSFLLTINLKLIKVHIEIKIVNKEAATKRSTLLHAQRQLCMVAVWCNKKRKAPYL